jgi:dTDP-4-dehydrorhamnose reductase
MRVLILGGTGMLGHKLWQAYRTRFDSWVTIRRSFSDYACYGLFDRERTLDGIDASDFDLVLRAFAIARPQVVINCIGIVKQLPEAKDPIASLTLNSLFPHLLANLCETSGVLLIHVSTDCVFSGRKGIYTEEDVADATDFYGRTKYLGEVVGPTTLTLRTSIIGRELKSANGLVEWFLSCRGSRVKGYTKAIYSGFTTLALSKIIADILEKHPHLRGLYHVASEPIDKYHLLTMISEVARIPIELEPSPDVRIDRSLDSRRFQAATGFVPPSWKEMLREMVEDPTPYEQWRKERVP